MICLGRLAALGELGHPAVVVAELAVDRRAADQLEGLRQVRVALALALAGQLAGRPAEGLEERIVHLAVGDLGGTGAVGQAVERRRRARDGRDRVEQDLGRQELGLGVREVERVVGVERVGAGAELVGPARAGSSGSVLEVVAVLDERRRSGRRAARRWRRGSSRGSRRPARRSPGRSGGTRSG